MANDQLRGGADTEVGEPGTANAWDAIMVSGKAGAFRRVAVMRDRGARAWGVPAAARGVRGARRGCESRLTNA